MCVYVRGDEGGERGEIINYTHNVQDVHSFRTHYNLQPKKKPKQKQNKNKNKQTNKNAQVLRSKSVFIYVSKCSLYVLTAIPPRFSDPCNFITVLLVTRESEQTTLLFCS